MSKIKYTQEFKDETAKFILESGKSACSVVAELNIDKNQVCKWVRLYREKNNLLSYVEERRTKIDKSQKEIELERENKRLKNQQIRQNRKNSIYTHETDNYNSYVRNQKKELKIAKVSLIVMDEFIDLQKKCKAVVDAKKAECEEFGLPIDELTNTIDEQEAVIKAFKDKALSENGR